MNQMDAIKNNVFLPTPELTDANALRDEVINKFSSRTTKSKNLAAKSRSKHADKSAIGATFDSRFKEIYYPLIIDSANGSKLQDIDGNEYIDILQGLGASLFGHNPDFIRNALATRLEKGFPLGTQDAIVGEVAELFTQLTGHDRVCFSNTGTEAVMTALRLARTATGRDKVVMFTNSYHGHADPMLLRAPLVEYARRKLYNKLSTRTSTRWLAHLFNRPLTMRSIPAVPGIPASTGNEIIIMEYGNLGSLKAIQAARKNIAAVIVEPIQSRCPQLQPLEFLQDLRTLTQKHNITLIFDEMVTGFRLHPAGAQGLFDIQADIATYSKIAGGGLSLSAIAGNARYLDHIDGGDWQYGDDSRPETTTTFFAGTFCKHPLALTTAHAMLTRIHEEGPALQQGLTQTTENLVERLNKYTESLNLPIRYSNAGSFFAIDMTASRIEPETLTLMSYLQLLNGIFLRVGDKGGFIGAAHSDNDVEQIATTIEHTLATLKSANLI